MKFRRIDEDTVRCIVSKEDMQEFGIVLEDFFKNKNTYDYMRSALVAASFEAEDMNIKRNYSYVHRIIGDIISDERKRFVGR